MRAHHFFTILSTWFIGSTLSFRHGKWCFDACELDLNYAEFNDTNLALGSHKTRACQSRLRSDSLYLCAREYCEEDGLKDWVIQANETCLQIANASMPAYDDVMRRYPSKDTQTIRRLSADEALTFPILGEVVIPEHSLHERAFTTLEAAYYEYDVHLTYGWFMFYFWAAVVTIGISSRLAVRVAALRTEGSHLSSPDLHETFPPALSRRRGATSKIQAHLKRHISIPATFNNRCSEPIGWCTMPSRVQTLTILSFVLLNIGLCMIDYRTTDGNLFWPQKRGQMWRFVSDRTGIISFANFPLIWLFGMRNNVLLWITGWGYGTYNNFHRWVARVSTVQAVVHSIGYTVMTYERGGWTSFLKSLSKHYFWNGELATIAMCALLIFSVYGLRRGHYEIFLTLHIVLSVLVLVTMYYHVAIFPNGEWNIFIYPCVAIWLIDRLFRALKIFAFDPYFWRTRAVASFDTNSNLVKMEVPCERAFSKAKPGTYYYIYVLEARNLIYAHQNHPFTVAYINPGSRSNNTSDSDGTRSLLRPNLRRTGSTESDSLLLQDENSVPSLVFLIRPYDGFTSRLAQTTSLGPKNLRVLIEGPYGHSVALHEYPNILFIVGGTGIAVPLSHLRAMLSTSSSVISIRLVWAVREHAFLSSVIRDFGFLFEDERLQVEVHITKDEESKDDLLMDVLKNVEVQVGRPDVYQVIQEAAREGGQEGLAIVACGPGQMADQARQSSVNMLAKGYKGVEYFEESFKW
ncbi:unnamed protein product [Periconia digitata]|uniref:FAD-binding FR-type domain-containing protein n=1 Tax=Periconia digitata TaxID=1303443 RepID=A0A9W4UG82_9PLEO|nr:unnamed protein product [Periconia digitata]